MDGMSSFEVVNECGCWGHVRFCRGFIPSPAPSLAEEAKSSPKTAVLNRLNRAKRLARAGRQKAAAGVMAEARKILAMSPRGDAVPKRVKMALQLL